jgi:hypothetical protein
MMRSLCAAWKMANTFAASAPISAAIAQYKCDNTSWLPRISATPFVNATSSSVVEMSSSAIVTFPMRRDGIMRREPAKSILMVYMGCS